MTDPTLNELQGLFEAAPVGYAGLTPKGEIVTVNRAACDFLGWDASDIVGRPFSRLIFPGDRTAFHRRRKKVLETGGPETMALLLVQKDDGRLAVRLHLTATPAGDGGNIRLWATIMDVSELKQAEAALRRTTLSAEAAKRTQSEFLANMSHEFRTPLSAILGFADLLGDGEDLDETRKKQVAIIRTCGEHLLTLLEEILSLSRIDTGQTSLETVPFSLTSVINHVFHIMRIKANEKSLAFRYKTDAEPPDIVRGDKRKLTQVLMNLVSNAVKFTQEGEVTVRTGYCARHGLFRATVADTGPGIPADRLDHIFEPFFRSSDRDGYVEGAGLGLSISRKYVELMDGTLTVRGAGGRGSVFTMEVRLPADDLEPTPNAGPQRRVAGYAGKRKRVLLVDDNSDNIAMMMSLLDPLGFGVVVANSGEEAIDVAGRIVPDAVLLDFVMPKMDGLETLRRIRDRCGAGPRRPAVIGISADVVDRRRKRRFAAECDDFLSKPVDQSLLLAKLKHRLALDWIGPENDRPPCGRNAPRDAFVIPAPETLNRLRDLARRGALNDLESLLRTTAAEDQALRVFCETAAGFVDRCDEGGLLAYIQRMEEGLNGAKPTR